MLKTLNYININRLKKGNGLGQVWAHGWNMSFQTWESEPVMGPMINLCGQKMFLLLFLFCISPDALIFTLFVRTPNHFFSLMHSRQITSPLMRSQANIVYFKGALANHYNPQPLMQEVNFWGVWSLVSHVWSYKKATINGFQTESLQFWNTWKCMWFTLADITGYQMSPLKEQLLIECMLIYCNEII